MKKIMVLNCLMWGVCAVAAPVFLKGPEAFAFVQNVEEQALAHRARILATPSQYEAKGRVFYFSAQGSDTQPGTTPETARATLAGLAKLDLKKGDTVLFRRGDVFRGRIRAQAGVTYSAYGTGPKPTICASARDYARPELWRATGVPNVWACTEALPNVGIIAFDHTPQEVGRFDVKTGVMQCSRRGVASPRQLDRDCGFWCDAEKGILYLYSMLGNPGTRFQHIEIGAAGNAIGVGGNGVTIDNLHITLAGSHGVGSGTVKDLEVRNCVFDWLGGALLIPEGRRGGPCRFGNAVEVYGGCDGYRVLDCWMYQIYDTGITHQCHHAKDSEIRQFNVEYARNLIEYCFWSIEYYNAYNKYGETRNVYVHDNHCRLGGYGWGCPGREDGTPMFSIDDRPDKTVNYVNEGNVLERSKGYLVNNFGRHASPPGFVFRKNVYIQPRGWHFAHIGDNKPPVIECTEKAADAMRSAFGEDDGTYAILP